MSMYFREFNYHFFEPITFEQFYATFCPDYDFQSVQNAKGVFNDWLIYFCHMSHLFYRAQFVYHQGILERQFAIENRVPEEHSFSEYGLDNEWEYFSSRRGLAEHQDEYEKWCIHLDGMTSLAKIENNVPDSQSIGEVLEESMRSGREISQKQRPPAKTINELWFNTTINNSDEDANLVRHTPYPDYLKTSHWQRVRAAMMLIHKACCQADGCHELFQSWYFGWESDVDVHHLHYQNKGNERYADLALLCKDHHKQWHYNKDNGLPQIQILDQLWY